jgi:hypothetical protein
VESFTRLGEGEIREGVGGGEGEMVEFEKDGLARRQAVRLGRLYDARCQEVVVGSSGWDQGVSNRVYQSTTSPESASRVISPIPLISVFPLLPLTIPPKNNVPKPRYRFDCWKHTF